MDQTNNKDPKINEDRQEDLHPEAPDTNVAQVSQEKHNEDLTRILEAVRGTADRKSKFRTAGDSDKSDLESIPRNPFS